MDQIELQLSAARAELDALEHAVNQLPEVLEDKFRQQLLSVVSLNRHLHAEQQHMRLALSESLQTSPPSIHGHRFRQPALRLPKLRRPSLSPHSLAYIERMRQQWLLLMCSKRAVRLATGLALGGVFVVGASVYWQVGMKPKVQPISMQTRRLASDAAAPAPLLPAIPSTSQLMLKPLGNTWIEVQDLASNEVLLVGEFAEGEERTVMMRKGLRIRSGRPDLLQLQIDNQPPFPFGENQGLEWRTLLPP